MKKYKLGKTIDGPNPKCPYCKEYVHLIIGFEGFKMWKCGNCCASFEFE